MPSNFNYEIRQTLPVKSFSPFSISGHTAPLTSQLGRSGVSLKEALFIIKEIPTMSSSDWITLRAKITVFVLI
ncbi:MAG: hypothetical protein GY749_07610 [Desulfobacteraceae bacterium]|nr:hypothetical protein [Desulfobacteraceae bacterium]